MATAKKLPSGSWRVQVYSHKETLYDEKGEVILDKKGKPKKKPVYESFTSDDPSPAGKREAEFMAAEFALKKERLMKARDLSLTKGIDLYIENSDAVLSPTTIAGYREIQENGFQDLMHLPIKKLTNAMLQQAVNLEAKRPNKKCTKNPRPISPKTVSNYYGLITAVLNAYHPDLDCTVRLPAKEEQIKELLPPEIIFDVVKDTPIELPVLLAMWLSFSMSEVRGLTKSGSIKNGYLTINEVVVNVKGKDVRKKQAKTKTRIRRHKIPDYIMRLIERTDSREDVLVPMTGRSIYCRFTRLLKKNKLPHMTFHDLRHVNASVMALLKVPDKYAQERGGWKTDAVMKKVYTHTFTEERKKVDIIIDNYFKGILNPEEKKKEKESQEKLQKELDAKLEKELKKIINTTNPEDVYDAIIEFISHEISHKTKRECCKKF